MNLGIWRDRFTELVDFDGKKLGELVNVGTWWERFAKFVNVGNWQKKLGEFEFRNLREKFGEIVNSQIH